MRERERRSLLGAGEERVEVPSILPVLPVRDLVVFPGRHGSALGRQAQVAGGAPARRATADS